RLNKLPHYGKNWLATLSHSPNTIFSQHRMKIFPVAQHPPAAHRRNPAKPQNPPRPQNRRGLGSARDWDSLMTWVTLSNSARPPFFPVGEGIFDLARPLNFRGKKGVAPNQKCRGAHALRNALFRGKSVTHVMRSCHSRAGECVFAFANFHFFELAAIGN